jgi:hypothetical protein
MTKELQTIRVSQKWRECDNRFRRIVEVIGLTDEWVHIITVEDTYRPYAKKKPTRARRDRFSGRHGGYELVYDTLAAEPSEDARELVIKLREESHGMNDEGDWFDYFKISHEKAAALIKADRQRVREECAELGGKGAIKRLMEKYGLDRMESEDIAEAIEAAIMGKE